MQEEVQNMREESESTFLLDPLFNSPSPQDNGNQESSEDTDRARETEISELYIDEESQIEWSKNNLTANTFQTEPFPVRALSETNRYELKNFYEFIPEKMFDIKKEEEEFLEAKKDDFPLLEMKHLKVEWITFLCHEEMASQGDIDEHMLFSHGFNMNELPDEKRIKKNKKSNLVLQDWK